MDKIVKNIPLWGILFEKYGLSIKEDGFWIDLVQITGAERPDAQKEAEYIRNAYIADSKYILTVKAPEKGPESKLNDSDEKPRTARGRSNEMDTVSPGDPPYIGFPEYVKGPIMIKDEISFKAAEVFWEAD